jgi:hypothetical protein
LGIARLTEPFGMLDTALAYGREERPNGSNFGRLK